MVSRTHVLDLQRRASDPNLVASSPNAFICPISLSIMADPVTASDGYTYDRESIVAWLEYNTVSPTTNEDFGSTALVPNDDMRREISEWRALQRTRPTRTTAMNTLPSYFLDSEVSTISYERCNSKI